MRYLLLLLALVSFLVCPDPASAQLFGRRSSSGGWNASNYYEGPYEWGRWCMRGSCSMCAGVEAHNRALGRQWPRQQPVAVTASAVTQPAVTQESVPSRVGMRLETYRVQTGKRCVNGVCYPIYENRQRWVADPSASAVADTGVPAPQRSTPALAIKAILSQVDPVRGSVFYDLGCGTGQVLKEAMYTHGCDVYGIDIDPSQVQRAASTLASVNAIPAGASYKVNTRDATDISLIYADMVYVYLNPDVLEKIRWDTLKPGATVVAFQHPVPGLEMAEHSTKVDGEEYFYFTYTAPTQAIARVVSPPKEKPVTVDALFLTPSWEL